MDTPEYLAKSFLCPMCLVNSQQLWTNLVDGNMGFSMLRVSDAQLRDKPLLIEAKEQFDVDQKMRIELSRQLNEMDQLEGEDQIDLTEKLFEFNFEKDNIQFNGYSTIAIAKCVNCEGHSVWYKYKMIYPSTTLAPKANEDMPEKVRVIFEEARDVYPHSKRASAALLRLSLEELLTHLKFEGKMLNDKIKSLVAKESSSEIQKVADIVRHYGNKGIHAGEIELEQTEGITLVLFKFINLIIQRLISDKKQVDDIWKLVPQGLKEQIAKRDK